MKTLTYEFVKDQFAKEGYKLLSEEYVNCGMKLDYICDRGHRHSISWASFQQGHRCRKCYDQRNSKSRKGKYMGEHNPNFGKGLFGEHNPNFGKGLFGENHWNWKGGITPERKKDINSPEYKQWRTDIFIRDNYTCQTCDQKGGNLRAHHILPWSKFEGLIRYNTSNGITLCRSCHEFLRGKEMIYAHSLIKLNAAKEAV